MLMDTNKFDTSSFAYFFKQVCESDLEDDKLHGFLAANQLIMYFVHTKNGEEKVYGCDDDNRISYVRILNKENPTNEEPTSFFAAIDIINKLKNPEDDSETIFGKDDVKKIKIIPFKKVKEKIGDIKKIKTSNKDTADNIKLVDKV